MEQTGTNSARESSAIGRCSCHRARRRLKLPVLFGAAFAAIQAVVALVRFGSSTGLAIAQGDGATLARIIPGMALFFVAGLLVGLLANLMLRNSCGAWRRFVIGGTLVATPFAVCLSLVGGLLGPPFVIAYALIPFLVLAGLPAAGRAVWLRFSAPPSAP